MAKIVAYDTLIPEIAGLQPNIAWLLANVPQSIVYDMPRERAQAALEDLQLKFSELQGKILELEANVVELEEGTVTVTLPEGETDDDLAYVEEALRTTLAEMIVQRGEEQLERERLAKNMRYCQLYGGDFTKLVQGPSCYIDFELDPEAARRWREKILGTQESIETWTVQPPDPVACPVLPGDAQVAAHTLGYWAVQDAIEEARIDHEEAEAFGAALAAVGAYGELTNECLKSGGKCDSLQCDGCDPPSIDMDGQLLD